MKIKFKREQDKFWTSVNLTLAVLFFIGLIVGPLYSLNMSSSSYIIFTFCFLFNFVVGMLCLYDAIEWDY